MKETHSERKPVTQDPVERIEEEYLFRKSRNEFYSLAAYARDLGISAPQLSRILNRTRNLTPNQAGRLALGLNLSEAQSSEFIRQVILKAPKNAKVSKLSREDAARASAPIFKKSIHLTALRIDQFRIIAQWYHLAILNLLHVKGFKAEPAWIAQRLGISNLEARGALQRLLDLGFVELCEKKGLKRTIKNIYVETKHSEPEMRKFHASMIDRAKAAMQQSEDVDFHARLINSITFPVSRAFVPELTEEIIKFQKKILSLIQKHPFEEVYQLNCQLFPLTKHLAGRTAPAKTKTEK